MASKRFLLRVPRKRRAYLLEGKSRLTAANLPQDPGVAVDELRTPMIGSLD
jgi:hypothetical protein